MSRRAEICSRTTAIGSVWVVSEDHLSLGDIRKFIAAAASLADDVPVSVTDRPRRRWSELLLPAHRRTRPHHHRRRTRHRRWTRHHRPRTAAAMSALTQLADCQFYTTRNDNGRYIGHCREYPSVRTTTHPNSIDALDEAITNTRNKIAELDQALTGTGPAARPPHPSDEYGDTW